MYGRVRADVGELLLPSDRRIRDDRANRVTIFEQCLVRFLDAGVVSATSTRSPHSELEATGAHTCQQLHARVIS